MKKVSKSAYICLICLTFFLTLILASSCAHQNGDDLFEKTFKASVDNNEAMSQEEGVIDGAVEELTAESGEETFDIDEMMASEMASSEKQPAQSEAEATPSGEEAVEMDAEMAALLEDSEGETGEGANAVAEAVSTPEESIELASNDPVSTEEPSFETGLEMEAAVEAVPPKTQTIKLVEKKRQHRRIATTSPTIPGKAFMEQDKLLNRYYVLRTADTPESVSQLLFGHPNQATDLLALVGGTQQWAAGKAVYYSSPDQPEDKTMKSFYFERAVRPETYTVKNGDSLASIAKNRYGTTDSWVEIALINQMGSPDSLKVGQSLALVPIQLGQYARDQWVVASQGNEPQTEVDSVPPSAEPPSLVDELFNETAAPKLSEYNPRTEEKAPQLKAAKRSPTHAGFDFGTFIQNNALLLGVAFLIATGALFFLVVLPRRERF